MIERPRETPACDGEKGFLHIIYSPNVIFPGEPSMTRMSQGKGNSYIYFFISVSHGHPGESLEWRELEGITLGLAYDNFFIMGFCRLLSTSLLPAEM